jgi:hypothetical protein
MKYSNKHDYKSELKTNEHLVRSYLSLGKLYECLFLRSLIELEFFPHLNYMNNNATVKIHGTVSVCKSSIKSLKHLHLLANSHRYVLHKNASTQLTLSADKNPDQNWTAYKNLESVIASNTLFSLSNGNHCCLSCFSK